MRFDRGRKVTITKDDQVLNSCSVIYLVLPPFWSHSDAFKMDLIVEQEIRKDKEMVFVANDVSDGVLAVLHDRFPDIRAIRLS